ncbi:MAG: Hint domain-containing protein [Paracoccaceae bacterium]
MPVLTTGLVIATEEGEVPAETLRVGDRVLTRDNGVQRIRWIGSSALTDDMLKAHGRLTPVSVRQGALDGWLPEAALIMSPNQRILAPRDRSLIRFEEHEALVSAKLTMGSREVAPDAVAGGAYWHVLFDRHEMILTNGAWYEAFHPGDISLNGLGNAQRFEIFALFPDLQMLLAEVASVTPRSQPVRLPQRH